MSTVTQVPPPPRSSAAEPSIEAASSVDRSPRPVTASADVTPAWSAPPDPPGPLTGLYLSMCGLILLVVSLIVAAGITGAVWVLVIAVVALFAALWLLVAVLMRFIN